MHPSPPLRLRMGLPRWLAFSVCLALVAPVFLHAQGRIEGDVVNGTRHQPVPDQQVRLLSPRGGMQEVATASTDSRGHFALSAVGIDSSGFYMVETRFHEVPYHLPVQFDSTGGATANLTVYDLIQSDPGLRVGLFRILVRAEGAKARVEEQYEIQNASEPPRAYANSRGTFRFHVPPEVTKPTVAVAGLMGVALPQTPQAGKSAGNFSLQYPFKPGATTVTVGYEMDYTPQQFALTNRVEYPVDRMELYVSPASLTVRSPLFKAVGVDRTNDVQKLEAENLSPGAALDVRIAGEGAAATSRAEGSQPEAEVKVVPNSMVSLGVPLVLCFLLFLLWALGIRLAREWAPWQERRTRSPAQKRIEVKADALLNSLADLDELFASGKIVEAKYWKERLELKAKLVAVLKKAPPWLLESYAARQTGP